MVKKWGFLSLKSDELEKAGQKHPLFKQNRKCCRGGVWAGGLGHPLEKKDTGKIEEGKGTPTIGASINAVRKWEGAKRAEPVLNNEQGINV